MPPWYGYKDHVGILGGFSMQLENSGNRIRLLKCSSVTKNPNIQIKLHVLAYTDIPLKGPKTNQLNAANIHAGEN